MCAGARQIQGTLNGLGERCGNANLISLIPTLVLKLGFDTGVTEEGLRSLTDVSRWFDERLNREGNASAAYVGEIVPYAPSITPSNAHFLYHDMPCRGCLGSCVLPLENGRFPCVDRLETTRAEAAVSELLAAPPPRG